MRTLYSCGFAFVNDFVVLIQKNRPAWQAGKLNGVGGHVEDGELFHDAMVREFKEEAGLLVPKWEHFATLTGSNSRIAFFRTTLPSLDGIKTMTDEDILAVRHGDLPDDVVPNLRWLVPMALSPELAEPVEVQFR
jgi:8-oxo-dGTP diphosphatase